MEPQAAQEPQDPRPILWTVSTAYDRRADMLWQSTPCRDAEQVIAAVRAGIEKGATEIKVRDFTFRAVGSSPQPATGGSMPNNSSTDSEASEPQPTGER